MTGEGSPGELARRLAEAWRVPCRLRVLEEGSTEVLHDGLGAEDRGAERLRMPVARGGELEIAWRGGEPEIRQAAEALGEAVRLVLGQQRELDLFSRELAERYEQITLLTTISDILGSVIRVDRATEAILGELVDAFGGGRATLWLTPEPDGETTPTASVKTEGTAAAARPEVAAAPAGAGATGEAGEAGEAELRPFACRGRCDSPVESLALEARLARRVYRTQEAAQADPSPGEDGGEGPGGTGEGEGRPGSSLLAVPVSYAPSHGPHRRLGVLSLLGGREDTTLPAGRIRLLEAVAHQIGAAVQTGRLVEQSLRRERVLAELSLAHDLQAKLLPRLEGFSDLADVAARSEPAEVVGGDFYLLIRLPRGRLGVMLGDVSSHGFSAALIMALTMSTAAICAREEEEPGEVLGRIHRQLLADLESTEMYMSVFYGVLDPREGRLLYANAGHPFAWRVRGEEGTRLGALDPPLGMTRPRKYGEADTSWRTGRDLALLCTDGLVAGLGDGVRQAEDRLVACAAGAASAGAAAVIEALFSRSEVRAQADDRSALAVRI